MSRPDAPESEAADEKGAARVAAPATGEWVKTVVDGLTAEDDGSRPTAEADDEVVDAEVVDAAVDEDAVDEDAVDEDAVVVDAEIVEDEEPEVDEAEVLDAAAEGDAEAAATTDGPGPGAEAISVEDLVVDLERVTAERDQYLDASRRLQAEFENYRKQVGKREADARERANDALIGELLPILDAFDGALANGAEDLAPMRSTFLDALVKQGLERIDPDGAAFDPNLHEAVMHEDDAETDGPVVAEVMRAGYTWKGRVLRPAMVRTRG